MTEPSTKDDGTRRTVEELQTTWSLYPDLHEIYVEGRSDAGVLEWFLRSRGKGATVYPVSDRVNVDFDVTEFGLNFGEKGKVVATALRFKVLGIEQGFTCIADQDYWLSLEDPPGEFGTRALLLTDYADLESYCFSESVVEKLLLVCLRAPFVVSAADALRGISDALRTLFVGRWLLRREVPGLDFIQKIEKRLSISDGRVVVNKESLISDTIGPSKVPGARDIDQLQLLEDLEEALAATGHLDPRFMINGHDIAKVLIYFINATHPALFKDDRKNLKDPDTVSLLLLGCLDSEEMSKYPMFAALLERIDSH